MLSHMLRASVPRIKVIGATQNQSASSQTTLAINKPTGTEQNDLMVAFITSAAGSVTFTSPSGWTEVYDLNNRTIAYKVAGASEGSSYTFTSSGSATIQGFIVTCKNAVYDTIGTLSVTAQNPVAPAITTGANNSLVFCWATQNSNTPTFTLSDWTSIINDTTTAPVAGLFAKTFVTAGSTDDVTVTGSTATTNRAMLLSIKPN